MRLMTINYELVVFVLGLSVAACGSNNGNNGDDPGGPQTNATVDMGPGMADSTTNIVDDPFAFEPNADCEFDEGQAGKGPGAQIANFMPEQYNGTLDDMGRETGVPFHFHLFCGGGSEVVWVFLTTGWCGACETYADKALDYLQEHAPRGLRVVWIVGEDAEYNPPSKTYMSQYRTNKLDRDRDGVVSDAESSLPFIIIRDNGFNNTRRFIDPSAAGSSLPRQYVLDASNMLMVFASDPRAEPPRPFIQGECEMRRLIGVLDVETCEGYMGE